MMNAKELNQVMENISMSFDNWEKIEHGMVNAPDGSLIVGGPFTNYIEVLYLKDDMYLLKPTNKFWCYLSILKRDKENPYIFIEVKNIVHYEEYNITFAFEREILQYNKDAGILTLMSDLVNFNKKEFMKLI